MHCIKSSLLAALVGCATLTATASERLICRGGDGMSVVGSHDMDGTVPISTTFYFEFQKAPFPASQAAPAPGQCALQRRSFLASEPDFYWGRSDTVQYAFHYSRTSSNQVVEGHFGDPLAAEWQSILDGIRYGTVFKLEVDLDGGAWIPVTTSP